jgi:antitoxin ParD1/3/4
MDQAEKLSVTVTPQMAQMIREKVESGQYASASEVIRASLRALLTEDEERAERLAWVKARIRASFENPGRGHSNEEVFAAVRARLQAKAAGGFNEAPQSPLE